MVRQEVMGWNQYTHYQNTQYKYGYNPDLGLSFTSLTIVVSAALGIANVAAVDCSALVILRGQHGASRAKYENANNLVEQINDDDVLR